MPGKALGESLQLDKLGTKVTRQRSSLYQGTDIQDVLGGSCQAIWYAQEAGTWLETRLTIGWRRGVGPYLEGDPFTHS